jgi:acetyltransferase-like isoleucine patch superfamily enzyme
MNRLQQIRQRYGRRWPVVVCVRAAQRSWRIRERAALGWLRLTTNGAKGTDIALGSNVSVTPGSNLNLGSNLFIGPRCIFEISVNPSASVSIGSDTWITHDCHICSYNRIEIGSDVLIGEFVSIRDTTHTFGDTTVPMKSQPDVRGEIVIEDDVWIGRGCLIQGKAGGVIIGRGAIIAANSVVSQSVPSMEIWGGAPARFIKQRQAESEVGEEQLTAASN